MTDVENVPLIFHSFTWREFVQKDCHARNLTRQDAMDPSRWKKLIKSG